MDYWGTVDTDDQLDGKLPLPCYIYVTWYSTQDKHDQILIQNPDGRYLGGIDICIGNFWSGKYLLFFKVISIYHQPTAFHYNDSSAPIRQTMSQLFTQEILYRT